MSLLINFGFWGSVIALAIIASAETLLCATATDRMHSGEKTDYDKELKAQGYGNLICGIFGAIPVCGVIVRSSANIEAGAKTKWSSVMHGAWILILVAFIPSILAYIPTACLAAILVFTGWKLFNFQGAVNLFKTSKPEFIIWAITLGLSLIHISEPTRPY